jgi:hypothetical protein
MRRVVAISLAVLGLAACGGNGDAEDVLAETASNLEKIESGNLMMRLAVTPRGDDPERFGFQLRGPFSLAAGKLPEARIEYTQFRGPEQATVTVISTEGKAYVEIDGQAYELARAQSEQLRAAAQELRKGQGLGELGLDDWIEDPKLSDGGTVDGVETDRIDATLDVPAAAQDLVELARGLAQGSLERLSEADEETVARATRSAKLQLFTGQDDRLLRRLDIDVDLGFDVPSELRAGLGELVGARIEFDLAVADPNRPVAVQRPQDVLPYTELPGQ